MLDSSKVAPSTYELTKSWKDDMEIKGAREMLDFRTPNEGLIRDAWVIKLNSIGQS